MSPECAPDRRALPVVLFTGVQCLVRSVPSLGARLSCPATSPVCAVRVTDSERGLCLRFRPSGRVALAGRRRLSVFRPRPADWLDAQSGHPRGRGPGRPDRVSALSRERDLGRATAPCSALARAGLARSPGAPRSARMGLVPRRCQSSCAPGLVARLGRHPGGGPGRAKVSVVAPLHRQRQPAARRSQCGFTLCRASA